MTLLDAAKEMKYFIDTMPPGECVCSSTGCDVRETEGYKLAALAIEQAEAKAEPDRGLNELFGADNCLLLETHGTHEYCEDLQGFLMAIADHKKEGMDGVEIAFR